MLLPLKYYCFFIMFPLKCVGLVGKGKYQNSDYKVPKSAQCPVKVPKCPVKTRKGSPREPLRE
jgi:hypothetical protein